MEHSHRRLHALGIVALAAIAILGWVREPERHRELESAARVTFASPRNSIDPLPLPEAPVRPELPVLAEAPKSSSRVPAVQRTPEPERLSAASGVETAHPSASAPQDRERTVEDDGKSGRPEPPTAPPPPQSPGTVRSKERSTARSAAIIAGAAAAGAAIGGLAGGGKGAAIGAIAGGAGGYLYDRRTRRRDASGIPTVAPPGSDNNDATERNDFRESRLAQRFGTPGFNGGRL
jgi:hypothetical protein